MLTIEQALRNSPAPSDIRNSQVLLDLEYYNFEGIVCVGQLMVHCALAAEIRTIFSEILKAQFPIFQMKPVSEFGWSDDLSMEQNNCSAFNYRLKVGKPALSAHATGRAIDINPCQNPYIMGDLVLPPQAKYDVTAPGALLENGTVVQAFESRGWIWGGRWDSRKDFHHFEKPAE